MPKAILPPGLDFHPIKEKGACLYAGGLQIRGAYSVDSQLSLYRYWTGEMALHLLYPLVRKDDVPFAQDCFGDQYLQREGKVYQLFAETGEIEFLKPFKSAKEFLDWVDEEPIEYLSLPENLELSKGKLLLAYPPFCSEEGNNASIKEVENDEVISFHAELARQLFRSSN